MYKPMSVSTIRGKPNAILSNLPYIIGVIGIILVIYFSIEVVRNMDNLKGKAALEVQSFNMEADAYVNDQKVGVTPVSLDNLLPGDNKITLKASGRQYETTMNFIKNSGDYIYRAGVKRDLGVSDYFSSGMDVWFEKDKSGNVLRVVSEPSGAHIYIDTQEQGTTPFSSDKLSDGEYTLRVDYPGYEFQESRINIQKGYVLNLKVKLFPSPVSSTIRNLPDAKGFYNITTDNNNLISDTQTWAKAIIYWNKTRGVNLDGVGINKEPVFDYFLDYKGDLFDREGNSVVKKEDYVKFKDAKNGAYLGRISDPEGLTNEAKNIYKEMGASGLGGKKALVLETGTGWLRVRDAANLNGLELIRVNVGQEYPVLEETTGWVKIKVSDTVQGWVSADYVKVSE